VGRGFLGGRVERLTSCRGFCSSGGRFLAGRSGSFATCGEIHRFATRFADLHERVS